MSTGPKLLRRGGLALVATLAVTSAPLAGAYWQAGGSGSGAAPVATVPAAGRPPVSVSGRTVTVSWPQGTLDGRMLGSYTGGGYRLRRYADAGASGTAATGPCAALIAGETTTVGCAEDGVPYGVWQYTVTPVLGTFSADEGPRSASVRVVPPAPLLDAVTAANPAPDQPTGAIEMRWAAVADVAGYNVYRRTAAGDYDFARPLNGAVPATGTAYTDAGAGLTAATTYHYAVRAVAGSPAVESASSRELGATAISRPAAPGGVPAATAGAGGTIALAWTAVTGVAGYNVYRRTSAGSYDFSAPRNGATLVAGTSWTDGDTANGTTYVYTVRAAITGAGGAPVESVSSAETGPVAADGVPPPAPSAVSLTSGGHVLNEALCGAAAGTRFINTAGRGAVAMTATITTPEPGQTLLLSATTSGSAPVSAVVAAGATTVSGALDLTTLVDGPVTVTARSRDSAGNVSAPTAPADPTIKDVVPAPLSGLTYIDNALVADALGGVAECGAAITAIKTAGANIGRTFPTSGTFRVGTSGSFSSFTVDAATLAPYGYDVRATDLAGNAGAPVAITGSAVL